MEDKKRPRGRPPKHRVPVSKESYAYAKKISKQYADLKDEVELFERKMKSLVRLLKARSVKGFPLALGVDERYKDYPLSDEDKSRMMAYIDAKEKVYLVEKGIGQMEEGEWKEIAKDQILAGIPARGVTKLHNVSDSKRDRAIREAVYQIAVWYDIVSDWNARKTGKMGVGP